MWRRRSQWALRSLKKTWPGKQRAINGVILFHPSFICSMTSAADVGFGRLGVELRWRSRGRAQDRGSLKTQWKSEPGRWAAATRLRISSRKQMGGLLKSGLWTHQVVYMKTCAPLCKVQGAGNVLKIELFFIFSARICWLIMSRDSLLLSSSVSLPLMLCEAFQLVALITSQHIRLMQHSHDWKEKKEKRNGSWNCITAARRRSLHYQCLYKTGGEKDRTHVWQALINSLKWGEQTLSIRLSARIFWWEKRSCCGSDSWFHPPCVGEKNALSACFSTRVTENLEKWGGKARKWGALFDKEALFLSNEEKKWERSVKQWWYSKEEDEGGKMRKRRKVFH